MSTWRERNREYLNEKSKKYYREHKEEKLKWEEEYRTKKKTLVMSYYTKGTMKCQCPKCDIKGINFLTIEHINGGGSMHRKTIKRRGRSFYNWIVKNNYPKEYTVLCWNCNCSKKNGGICAHYTES